MEQPLLHASRRACDLTGWKPGVHCQVGVYPDSANRKNTLPDCTGGKLFGFAGNVNAVLAVASCTSVDGTAEQPAAVDNLPEQDVRSTSRVTIFARRDARMYLLGNAPVEEYRTLRHLLKRPRPVEQRDQKEAEAHDHKGAVSQISVSKRYTILRVPASQRLSRSSSLRETGSYSLRVRLLNRVCSA